MRLCGLKLTCLCRIVQKKRSATLLSVNVNQKCGKKNVLYYFYAINIKSLIFCELFYVRKYGYNSGF